jgi:hypothetical protein
MRLGDWRIIALELQAAWLWDKATDRHLTTDPACARYMPPRPGSRLDRWSRGHSCTPCMQVAAWGWASEPETHDSGSTR